MKITLDDFDMTRTKHELPDSGIVVIQSGSKYYELKLDGDSLVVMAAIGSHFVVRPISYCKLIISTE